MATVSKTAAPARKTSSPVAAKSNGAAVKAKSTVAKAKPAAPATKVVVAKPAVHAAATSGKIQVKTQAKAKPTLEQKEKVKKPKLVRDSFTMPEAEYQVLGDVKKACLKAGVAVKKSELLRVGVALLKAMDVAKLKDAIAGLSPLKAGRPKKDK